VVEYYSDKLDHYLISAWPDEIGLLDGGTEFKRTGERFKAWLHASDAPASAVTVCRFYASGPNSHFYTADAAECQYLKSLQEKQAADAAQKGQPFPGWQFEAIAFYAIAPQAGACPAGTLPVWRAYNGRAAENDANHRFTATEAVRRAMAVSWSDEGLAFCAPA
jgi:serine protease